MRLILLLASTLCFLSASAQAHSLWLSAPLTNVVQAVGTGDEPYLPINWFKACSSQTFNSGSTPAILNSDGYPTSAPSAEITYTCPMPSASEYDGLWEVGWTGTGGMVLLGTGMTVDCTGCSDPQGCFLAAGYIGGTNCAVTFKYTAPSSEENATVNFPTASQGGHSFSYSDMDNAYLIRVSDATAYTQCASGTLTSCFTPEAISIYQGLGSLAIRTMGMSFPEQAEENLTHWKYRPSVTAFSWCCNWPTTIWAGTASGTDQYTLGSYTDMPPTWTDGEVFQAHFTNASYPLLTAGTPASDSGVVQLPINASGTLTNATISSNTLTGTNSGTITAGMYLNDGVDSAGTCTIVSGSAGTYTTSGCSNVSSATTMYTYTPIADSQKVLVGSTPTNTAPTVYTSTGLTFSGCQNSAVACVDLESTSYSSSWVSGGAVWTTTVNVDNRGAVFVVGNQNIFVSAGIAAGQNGTIYYDGLLGFAVYSEYGINGTTGEGSVPIELQVALANAAQRPLWWNISPLFSTSDVTSACAYISANLANSLFLEFNNENWNDDFQGNMWAERGLALGWPLSSFQAQYSYIGLKIRQNFGACTAAWQNPHQLIRVNAGQLTAGTTNFEAYQFSGELLSGATYPLYCAYVGGTYSDGTCTGDPGYNTAPNRPKDFSDAYSAATYFVGSQVNGTGTKDSDDNALTLSEITGTCNGTNCTGLIAAASCYAAPSNATCGTGGTATLALQWMESDTYNGTLVGSSYCQTECVTAVGVQAYLNDWQSTAASDGKLFYAYEGAYTAASQTTASLAALGDSNASTDATNINNLIWAFKSSSQFYSAVTTANNYWFAQNSQFKGNAWLTLQGSQNCAMPSEGIISYSVLPGTYMDTTACPPFQSYNALKSINLPYLLNRDLDPASNDNSPAGVNEAA